MRAFLGYFGTKTREGRHFLYVARGGVSILSHLSPLEHPSFWCHVRPGRGWVKVFFCPRCGQARLTYGVSDSLCVCGRRE